MIGVNFVAWYTSTSFENRSKSRYTNYKTFLLLGLTLTYYLPYIYHGKYISYGLEIIIELTLFYVAFLIAQKYLSKKPKLRTKYKTPKNIYKIYVVSFLLWILSLLSGLDDPFLIFDRALNPRDYTHVRSSEGVITFISIGFTFFSTYHSACEFIRTRSLRELIIFLTFVAQNLLGGGKSSMVSIVLILLYAREAVSEKKISTYVFFRYGVIATLALVLSFGLFTREGSRTGDFKEMATRFVEYQQELILSSELYLKANLNSADYTLVGIVETLTAGIPSSFYPSKPQGALFTKFVNNEIYISNDPNHFATYGVQLEGKLVFGWLWPIIGAIILSLYLKIPDYLSGKYETPRIFVLWNCLLLLGFVRAGLLFTTPWMTFIITPLIYILLGGRKYLK